jgi:aminopeptidase-like protein
MGKRGLYSTLGMVKVDEAVRTRMNVLAYCDGRHSVLDLAEKFRLPAWALKPYIEELVEHNLIEEIRPL